MLPCGIAQDEHGNLKKAVKQAVFIKVQMVAKHGNMCQEQVRVLWRVIRSEELGLPCIQKIQILFMQS